MKIYKDKGKIVVEIMPTDVLFNNYEKDGALIDIDSSAYIDVDLRVSWPNDYLGLIAGLNEKEYSDLLHVVMAWLKEAMKKSSADHEFDVASMSSAYLPWFEKIRHMYKQQTHDGNEGGF